MKSLSSQPFFSEEGDMDSSKQHANGNGKESIDYCLST